jgi:hypothetical protein
MVLLTPVDGFQPSYFLNKFVTSAECVSEQKRIVADMETAYPGDKSYRIECREKEVLGTPTSAPIEQTNYTEVITKWAAVLHPQETFNLKVLTIKPVLGDRGPTGVLAFQLHMFYKTGAQAYILFIKNATVIGWIDAGIPDVEDEEEEEVFSYKDQA